MDDSTCKSMLTTAWLLVRKHEDGAAFCDRDELVSERKELCSLMNKLFFNTPNTAALDFPWKRTLLAIANVTCDIGDDEEFPVDALMVLVCPERKTKEEMDRVCSRLRRWASHS